ncbi:hypothetical protein GPL21_41675 [Bradyrhizobium pachyrhizi]|uniref:Uncharacterized protein n=1 Tax=Bradyrhizobium pachyrhizi TaxID=280333 RepID=A0A844SZN8_9BRAD|nr:hypothetical protein [Bradyrhizobium pachyrhizi]MVT71476.1 hypothetical protein [Bradyrhizobium pachyrhizi]
MIMTARILSGSRTGLSCVAARRPGTTKVNVQMNGGVGVIQLQPADASPDEQIPETNKGDPRHG